MRERREEIEHVKEKEKGEKNRRQWRRIGWRNHGRGKKARE